MEFIQYDQCQGMDSDFNLMVRNIFLDGSKLFKNEL